MPIETSRTIEAKNAHGHARLVNSTQRSVVVHGRESSSGKALTFDTLVAFEAALEDWNALRDWMRKELGFPAAPTPNNDAHRWGDE